MPSPRIVATVLCGDSESIVEAAIASVRDWVDAICLIDTGSTDGAIEKATALAGDRSRRCDFKWCGDFSVARNTALKMAAEHGATWALTVDTDERLEFPGYANQQQLLHSLDREPSVLAWLVPAKDGSYAKERFIRVPSALRWQGRTHECLVGAAAHERRGLSGCQFWEVPKSAAAFQLKLARDLDILLDETAEQPHNARWWYYLGQTYEGLQQFPQAVDAFCQCAQLDGWAVELGWACFCAARCLAELKQYQRAEELCALGMSRNPSAPELPWMLAWCCYQRGDWSAAVTWSNVAIQLGSRQPDECGLGFRHTPAWYEAPYDVLRYAYQNLGNFQLANRAAVDYQLAQSLRLRAVDPAHALGLVIQRF